MTPTVTPPTQVPPAVEPAGHGEEHRPRDRRRRGPSGGTRPVVPADEEAEEPAPRVPGDGLVDVIA